MLQVAALHSLGKLATLSEALSIHYSGLLLSILGSIQGLSPSQTNAHSPSSQGQVVSSEQGRCDGYQCPSRSGSHALHDPKLPPSLAGGVSAQHHQQVSGTSKVDSLGLANGTTASPPQPSHDRVPNACKVDAASPVVPASAQHGGQDMSDASHAINDVTANPQEPAKFAAVAMSTHMVDISAARTALNTAVTASAAVSQQTEASDSAVVDMSAAKEAANNTADTVEAAAAQADQEIGSTATPASVPAQAAPVHEKLLIVEAVHVAAAMVDQYPHAHEDLVFMLANGLKHALGELTLLPQLTGLRHGVTRVHLHAMSLALHVTWHCILHGIACYMALHIAWHCTVTD